MENEKIKMALNAHGIRFFETGGDLYGVMVVKNLATGEVTERPENLTGYTKKALLSWLGY